MTIICLITLWRISVLNVIMIIIVLEYEICYKGKCEEMEMENNEIIVGAKCNNIYQCRVDKYCS